MLARTPKAISDDTEIEAEEPHADYCQTSDGWIISREGYEAIAEMRHRGSVWDRIGRAIAGLFA